MGKYFDHTFSCEKGLVEQQHQLDNVGGGGVGGGGGGGRLKMGALLTTGNLASQKHVFSLE